MSKTLQVLFLHNINAQNKEVTIQNYNSFKNYNVDIQPIHDQDLESLSDSFPVPLKSFIPRGSRRWSTETVLLNYILINKNNLQHDYYMFCEYDCYCNCDLNEFIKPYYDYDVTAPFIVKSDEEPKWMWFDGLSYFKKQEFKSKKIGFRPSVFLLFKKESLILLAEAYKKLWQFFKDLNSESRLGTICNLLNFNITEYNNLGNSVAWFESVFMKNSQIIHPVKFIINNNLFIEEPPNDSLFNGRWYFGSLKDSGQISKIYGDVTLNPDGTITGYNNFNEKFWNIKNNNLIIYNGKGGITTIFKNKIEDKILIGDLYNGEILHSSRFKKKNLHFLVRYDMMHKMD